MRRGDFAKREFYHIYNRGVEQRDIFRSQDDYKRLLLCAFAFQNAAFFNHIDLNFKRPTSEIIKILLERDNPDALVRIVCFCLMPNHFHLLVQAMSDNGVPRYMQRLGNSFTKYTNIKYNRNGHLFGGKYNSIIIDKNEYLLHLSRYIHLNPHEIVRSKSSVLQYKWSSYQDYAKGNRWGHLLYTGPVISQFSNRSEYKDFVETEGTSVINNSYLLDS